MAGRARVGVHVCEVPRPPSLRTLEPHGYRGATLLATLDLAAAARRWAAAGGVPQPQG